MRDIRQHPTFEEYSSRSRWSYQTTYRNWKMEVQDSGAFARFYEMIEAEALRRCRMTKMTANAFRTSPTVVMYALYLELKERFEEVEE